MITLYPNDVTRQIVADAVNAGKQILWILDNRVALFFNPNVTVGNDTAGIIPTPTDGGVAFGADYVVQYTNTGFAPAASKAGLYTWNNQLTEIEDCAVAAAVIGNTIVVTRPVIG